MLHKVVDSNFEWKMQTSKKKILVEVRVIMILTILGSENSLQICRKVYGIVENMASIIMKEFYVVVKTHLKPLAIPKLIKNNIKENTSGFEILHEIPYIVNAINGNCIPITCT